MLQVTPVAPVTVRPERRWLIDQLLPQGELVLLDGATGVGKSSVCANLASYVSRLSSMGPVGPVLYISSSDQTDMREFHLSVNDPDYRHIIQALFDPEDEIQSRDQRINQLKLFIADALKEHQPRLVIVDNVESLLGDPEKADLFYATRFWQFLRKMCQLSGITVIVTRLRGMHETRTYGHFVRQGTQAADYIMTLHWHPVLPEKRVLTIARNLRGPIGAQWHLRYFPDGRYLPIICPPEDHVRPAKTAPQTWTSDEVIQHQHETVMELIREKIGTGMVPCGELLKYIVEEKGISERMYQKALGKLRYERLRQGNHWVYTSPRRADEHLQDLDQARLHAMKLDQECFEEAKARFLERRQPPADVIEKSVEPITQAPPVVMTRKAAG
jgi:archaellum biogenesis ATPase FlaH